MPDACPAAYARSTRITRRCPPGGSAASPRHQPAARACPAGTAEDGRCETPLPPPRRAHSIPALHHVYRRDLGVGSNKDGDSYVATLIGLRRLLRIEGVLVPPLLQLPHPGGTIVRLARAARGILPVCRVRRRPRRVDRSEAGRRPRG